MIRVSRASGYTLIEILGAFFIMTIILTLVTGIFVENGRQRAAALGMMNERLASIGAVDQLARDLEGTIFLIDSTDAPPDENPWSFRSEGEGELGAQSVRFVTQNAPATNRGIHASSWVEVVYFLEEDESQSTTLWRWIAPRPPTDAESSFPTSQDEGSMRIALDVDDFGVRFLGPEGDWQSEWDSAYVSPLTPLPVAAEISLRLLRDARLGESEEGLDMVPGTLHTRRVSLQMPPIDVTALIELDGDSGEEEASGCFTVANCMSEGDPEWYHAQLDDDCGGDDDLCDLLVNAEDSCWSTIEREHPGLAASAPGSCAE